MMKIMPEGSIKSSPSKSTGDISIASVEAPRGACTMLLELSSDGKIKQLSVRTASFRNWRGIEKAVLGNIVPDFPLINKSFNLSYAGTDL
jgi:Ni,Fe-hydrogenase III large subunit